MYKVTGSFGVLFKWEITVSAENPLRAEDIALGLFTEYIQNGYELTVDQVISQSQPLPRPAMFDEEFDE
jgi:hypothetical protein